MKKLIVIAVLALAIGFKGYSQFAFSVSPGIATNAANFGFKAGKVVPYVGFQLINGGLKLESTDHYYDGVDWVDDNSEMTVSANILMPSVGVKLFAIETGDLKAYFNLTASKPMIRGKMSSNGTEDEEFAETLEKVKMIGAELGFGVEYYFSSNFSIGGEYAIRYIGGNFSDKQEYGNDEYEEMKTSLRLAPTIAKLSLNFYFGGE